MAKITINPASGAAAAPGSTTVGTAELDFTSTPSAIASVIVTGQTGIGAGASVFAWIQVEETVDNNDVAHMTLALFANLQCSEITAGVGFTITAYMLRGLATGTYTVHWIWS